MRMMLTACVFGLLAGCAADATDADPAGESEQDLTAFRTTVTTNPSPVVVGGTTSIDVRVKGPGNAPVTQFDLLHTQPMHVIGVSADLQDFFHVHPAMTPGGSLRASARFARAQRYALFMEYDPAGPSGQVLGRASVTPAGAVTATAHLDATKAYDGGSSRTATSNGTVVELASVPGGMIMPNVSAHVVARFRNPNGTAVSDLTNWLGMPAHAIVVSEDAKTFVHAHGMPESSGGGHADHAGHDEASTSTGPVGIDLELPKAGLYKMFLQFQRGTTLITTSFVLQVMASHGSSPVPPPKPSCAAVACPSGQHCMVMGGSAMCM